MSPEDAVKMNERMFSILVEERDGWNDGTQVARALDHLAKVYRLAKEEYEPKPATVEEQLAELRAQLHISEARHRKLEARVVDLEDC